VDVAAALLAKLGSGTATAPLVATTAWFLVQTRGKQHPKQEEIHKRGFQLLIQCAKARQIQPEQFEDWFAREGLNDPNRFLPALDRALETLVGENGWLFDRQLLTNGPVQHD
jgi:hypothetical protein